ncbi:MAG: hypothetical protein ACPG31_09585 [Planctomycetota bacterium]
MLIARWGLVTLIFAVAFVFFGSVICPPLDEREAEESDAEVQYPLQEDPGTYKPLPGDLQIEDRFPMEREAAEGDAAGADQSLQFRVLTDQGQPLLGAMVHVMLTTKDGPVLTQELFTDADGKVTASKIPPSVINFRAMVTFDQYFDGTVGPMPMPKASAKPGTFLVMLPPSCRVVGKVQGTDGRTVVHGWVLLTPLDEVGEAIKLSLGQNGQFTSRPLAPGSYRLQWMSKPEEDVPASMIYTMNMGPLQTRHFEITIHDDKPQTPTSLPPGIVEVSE